MLAALAALIAVLLAACASSPAGPPGPNDDASRLYAEAKADLDNGAWDRAIKGFEQVEAKATGTLLGQQAMLDLAYAQHRAKERAAALATLDRFNRLHPSSPAFDYALYLRGVVNFNDSLGFMGDAVGQKLSERDQRASRDSYQAFAQLVDQFPASRYAEDARMRMDYIVNSLAEYEVHVARYYYRRGAYVAAANRAKQAVTEFERAPATEEALVIMTLSYDRLGLTELRDASDRVLRRNFPSSRYIANGELVVPGGPWWRPW
jgi:outer membrane protein assembly factor BamD